MSYLDQSVAQLRLFEGVVKWMYLDSVGKVTCAVGQMLPNVAAALRLPFRNQKGGDLAGADAVSAEFMRVSSMLPNKRPSYYSSDASLVLADGDIDVLLMATLHTFEAQLRVAYPGFDAMPEAAKLAVMDLAYNLGVEGLVNRFPHCWRSIWASQWQAAASQCERKQVSDARNNWTRNQFLLAAQVA